MYVYLPLQLDTAWMQRAALQQHQSVKWLHRGDGHSSTRIMRLVENGGLMRLYFILRISLCCALGRTAFVAPPTLVRGEFVRWVDGNCNLWIFDPRRHLEVCK